MSRYRVTFNGRRKGAIGITHRCSVEVDAESPEDAQLKAYDTHEHLSGVQIVEMATEDPIGVVTSCPRGCGATRIERRGMLHDPWKNHDEECPNYGKEES